MLIDFQNSFTNGICSKNERMKARRVAFLHCQSHMIRYTFLSFVLVTAAVKTTTVLAIPARLAMRSCVLVVAINITLTRMMTACDGDGIHQLDVHVHTGVIISCNIKRPTKLRYSQPVSHCVQTNADLQLHVEKHCACAGLPQHKRKQSETR